MLDTEKMTGIDNELAKLAENSHESPRVTQDRL
jgi:hypothetical protein